MPRRPVSGWYLLPRCGVPYFGPVPDGAVRLRAVGEELVDGGDGPAEVGAGVLIDEQAAEPGELVDGPVGSDGAEDDDDGGVQVVGQGSDGSP